MIFFGSAAEQTGLAALAVFRRAIARFDRRVQRQQQLRARPLEQIHRARLNQALHHAAIDRRHIGVLAELINRTEAPQLGSGLDDGLDRILPDILDRAKSEADRIALLVAHGGEAPVALVHIGRQHANAHFAALVDVLHDLRDVAAFRSQQGGHEIDRIMRFQIRDDIGQIGIGRGVRLIESVAGELGHLVENLFDLALVVAPRVARLQ